MSQRVYDLERLCAGVCMDAYRRKARTYEAAWASYHNDHQRWQSAAAAWHAPLAWPAEPDEPDDPRLPYRVEGDPVYCPDCAYGLKSKLSKLDGAACVYLREADGFRGQSDQPKTKSRNSEPPSPSPAVDNLDELDGWLRDWKAAYLGSDTMARQGSLPDSITLGTSWLVARAERILSRHDIARAFGQEITRWHATLIRYDPSEVIVERLKGVRCQECRRFSLRRKVGDDKVMCGTPACDRVLKLPEYQEMLAETLKDKTRKAS